MSSFKRDLRGSQADEQLECRACLQNVPEEMAVYDIYRSWKLPLMQNSTTMALEMSKVANIEITETDGHSRFICKDCMNRLSSSITFIHDVQQSDTILKSRINYRGTQNTEKIWPKPIQLDKNINEGVLENSMDVEIKKEVISDDELDNNGLDNLAVMDIKVEPEEITEQTLPIKVTVNGTISQAQMDQISSMTNGCEVYESEEYLESMPTVKEEPKSEEDGPLDLPLECMLCTKAFRTVAGLKAHVIAFHNYKTVKRKYESDGSPLKKTVASSDSLLQRRSPERHVCVTCRRIFTTSTDLRVHEVCHDKFCCFACNAKFDSFREVTQHRRRCKVKAQHVKPKTLGDVMRERAEAISEAKLNEESPSQIHPQCLKCKVSFKDDFYHRLHNAIQHNEKETDEYDSEKDNNTLEKDKEKMIKENDKYNKIETELESIFKNTGGKNNLKSDAEDSASKTDTNTIYLNTTIAQENLEDTNTKTEHQIETDQTNYDQTKQEGTIKLIEIEINITNNLEKNVDKDISENCEAKYSENNEQLVDSNVVNTSEQNSEMDIDNPSVLDSKDCETKVKLENNRQAEKDALIECLEATE